MPQLSHAQFSTATFDTWLSAQILKLSVDALSAGVLTCTACPQSKTGEYVIEYQGETLRYLPEKTYAFLNFVIEETSNSSISGDARG
jgi:hypothetical protein